MWLVEDEWFIYLTVLSIATVRLHRPLNMGLKGKFTKKFKHLPLFTLPPNRFVFLLLSVEHKRKYFGEWPVVINHGIFSYYGCKWLLISLKYPIYVVTMEGEKMGAEFSFGEYIWIFWRTIPLWGELFWSGYIGDFIDLLIHHKKLIFCHLTTF